MKKIINIFCFNFLVYSVLVATTFTFIPVQASNAAELHVLKNFSTSKCLSLSKNLRGARSVVATIRTCKGARDTRIPQSHHWSIKLIRDDKFSIRDPTGRSCLNLKKSKDNREGGSVKFVGCSGHPDQLWWINGTGGAENNLVKIKNVSTGKCLNVHRGRDNRDGGSVTVYTCAETPDQIWSSIPLRYESAYFGNAVRSLQVNHPRVPGDNVSYSVIYDAQKVIANGDMLIANKSGSNIRVATSTPRRYSRYRIENSSSQRPTRDGVGSVISSLSTPHNVSLWQNCVIPYDFVCTGFGRTIPSITEVSRINNAATFLTNNTVLNMRRAVGREDRINFCRATTAAAGLSAVGKQSGSQQITLSNTRTASMRTIYHETLHAIGFIHEHRRADRDNFIRVNTTNILPQWSFAYAKADAEELNSITPYNTASVMHYSSFAPAFSVNPMIPNITNRAGTPLPLSNSGTLPQRDIDGINRLYASECGAGFPPLQAHRSLGFLISGLTSDDRDGGLKFEIDYYAKVEAGPGSTWRPEVRGNPTQKFRSGVLEDPDNSLNPNWSFFNILIPSGNRYAKISFQLWDEDTFSDERIDINPIDGIQHLEYIVDTLTGDIYSAFRDGSFFTPTDIVGSVNSPITIQRGTEGDIKAQTTVSIFLGPG